MQTKDEFYIKRCLQIAKNGLFTARPNPSVGAVIVVDDVIIGEGFTSAYGGNHAEVNAINSVLDKQTLAKATIYVTLEPCSHFGKTPPCADLIVKHQFKKVVIGCVDSNSLVAGKGIERLKNANIEVVVGVLEKECFQHHKRFFTFQNKKRPYIILKWAETKDSFIYPELDSVSSKLSTNASFSDSEILEKKNVSSSEVENSIINNRPIWISNSYSKQLVHKWRAKEQAILVGTNTVLVDNPKLNVRSWTGENPTRIIIDKNLQIPENASVYDGSVKTIFLIDKNLEKEKIENLEKKDPKNNIIFERMSFSPFWKLKGASVCAILFKHNIQSVIIEGGAKTLQTFIDEGLWDEAKVFVGDVSFEKGIKAPDFQFEYNHQEKIKNDILKTYYND